MIQLPYSLDELDLMAQAYYQKLIINVPVLERIEEDGQDPVRPVMDFVFAHLQEIITARPAALEAMIPAMENLSQGCKDQHRLANPGIEEKEVNKWFNRLLFYVFNYDFDHLSFTKRYDGRLAYEHAEQLNMTTCPYCNAQFTFTIKKRGSKTRPHFDHFLHKASHPYFALSFYNLIPSCYVCNSSLKGQKPFRTGTHIHPFLESIENAFRFRTNVASADFLVNRTAFSLSAEATAGCDPGFVQRAKASLDVFAIEDRYAFHRDYVGEIISKSHMYSVSAIRELFEQYEVDGNRIFKSEQEILEMIMGNYLQRDSMHKRILSKLSRDIVDEFGIKLP